jgi:hypothetical protein
VNKVGYECEIDVTKVLMMRLSSRRERIPGTKRVPDSVFKGRTAEVPDPTLADRARVYS